MCDQNGCEKQRAVGLRYCTYHLTHGNKPWHRCKYCNEQRQFHTGKDHRFRKGDYVVERIRQRGDCVAHVWHGPGHQSRTFCTKPRDRHKVHSCTYGEFDTETDWEGNVGYGD